ncbi:hypothetical protein SteCoe_4910 [Stentor coeruleus]|uniref:VDE lipocalin domain-containing protein n=1 Tax=Stentor coeruleus TaxID=5963 RepID=A0A1R2CTM7_9CILI|nr:hypothetical protein SteCoe_4910 [Stentor coeruleus]
MKKLFWVLVVLVSCGVSGQCDEKCLEECKESLEENECESLCGCAGENNEKATLNIGKLTQCTWVYKDVCKDVEDFDACIAESGCNIYDTYEAIVKNLPPSLWDAAKITTYSPSTGTLKKASKLNTLSLSQNYIPTTIQTSLSSLSVKTEQLCESFIACLYNGNNPFSCASSLSGSSCESLNQQSFKSIKSTIGLNKKETSGLTAAVLSDFKGLEVGFCKKNCIQNTCASVSGTCFDKCLENCAEVSDMSLMMSSFEFSYVVKENSYAWVYVEVGIVAVMLTAMGLDKFISEMCMISEIIIGIY